MSGKTRGKIYAVFSFLLAIAVCINAYWIGAYAQWFYDIGNMVMARLFEQGAEIMVLVLAGMVIFALVDAGIDKLKERKGDGE